MKSLVARKLDYIRFLASIRGVNDAMLRWELLLPLIHINIGGNILYRLLMDMYMHLNININPTKFQWHNLDFEKMFVPEMQPHWYTPNLGQLSPAQIENLMWAVREQLSTREGYYWKKHWYHALKIIWWFEDILRSRGVEDIVLKLLRNITVMCEAKCKITTYVGTAIVGLSVVMPNYVWMRSPYNFKDSFKVYTINIYENYVGFSLVGFTRVISPPYGGTMLLSPKLAEHVKSRVDDFRTKTGMVHGSPEEVLWQRVFFWQRYKRLHEKGGEHQIKLQSIITKVKQICNQEGIVAQHRMAYIAFAEELAYYKYKGHRLWKHWKEILTEDEIIDKYKRMGCDESILNKIRSVI